jgi:hypothetical protein
MRKEIVISLAILATLVLSLTMSQSVNAVSAAYTTGYFDGRNSAASGTGYHPECSFQHSETYCFDYKLGYTVGFGGSCLVHRC